MILFHHSHLFWENSKYWIEPKSFDTLFAVILTLYLILTFIPDFVKYFKVSSLVRVTELRKHTFGIVEQLVNDIEKETTEKKHIFLSTYLNFLTSIDITFINIEEKLHNLWKKYVYAHLTVIVITVSYLFFSACFNDEFQVHKFIISGLIILLLLPFLMSLINSLDAIKPGIKLIEDYMKKIGELNKAYKKGKTKGVIEFIVKNAEEYLK